MGTSEWRMTLMRQTMHLKIHMALQLMRCLTWLICQRRSNWRVLRERLKNFEELADYHRNS